MLKIKKSLRHLARSLAVQGLYCYKINHSSIDEIKDYLSSNDDPIYEKIHQELFNFLLEQGINEFDQMLDLYKDLINRPLNEINLIEKIILVLAAIELTNNLSVPSVVIINEAVELTKLYGAVDSYKFINNLVDKLAKKFRLEG